MLRRVVTPLFAVTGFSALCLQVVWQRVISIHNGVDLFSSATVVAAFMAGLGGGSLLGGVLADRLGPRRSILAFAVASAAIGTFGWASIGIFYDGYRALATYVQSLPAAFAFHFALLVLPTTLMGLSLPLLSRGVARSLAEAPSVVGRLYAVNTLGAAAGAAIGGWLLLGNLGFIGTVRLASSLNLLAGIAASCCGASRMSSTLRRLRVPRARPGLHRFERALGRGWRCMAQPVLWRSRLRWRTSGSWTRSCARTLTRLRMCSRCTCCYSRSALQRPRNALGVLVRPM